MMLHDEFYGCLALDEDVNQSLLDQVMEWIRDEWHPPEYAEMIGQVISRFLWRIEDAQDLAEMASEVAGQLYYYLRDRAAYDAQVMIFDELKEAALKEVKAAAAAATRRSAPKRRKEVPEQQFNLLDLQ
jgi:hypothetical protein